MSTDVSPAMKMRAAALAVVVLLAPTAADAFCGFYVDDGSERLFADASMVVLMRDGTRTVLSMRNDYRGPPEDFALVVPVPEVIGEDDVRILPADVFESVEKISSPRLVEYWEHEPMCLDPGVGYGFGSGMGSGLGVSGVTVAARFAVGEYDIVVLDAAESAGLETWLRQEGYRIPPDAASLLRPYVEQGMKFFVAKVDVDRVAFDRGKARLSPLRIHYDSEELSLPIRLGLMNADREQDLLVYVLARGHRYEVANRPNVTIPTNLVVRPETRGRFAQFYSTLFDRLVARNPGAVVTEYSWTAAACDPCPGPPLDAGDVSTLGGDVIPSSSVLASGTTMHLDTPAAVEGDRSAEAFHQRLRGLDLSACGRDLRQREVAHVEVGVRADGRIHDVDVEDAPAELASCLRQKVRSLRPSVPFERTAPGRFSFSMEYTPRRGVRSAHGFTLTRLHYRYSAADAPDDLVFRVAEPIQGGNGMPDEQGRLSQDVTSAQGIDQFQARYAILHEWEGPMCRPSQTRMHMGWGGPPGAGGPPNPTPALDLAMSSGPAPLAWLVRGPVPSIGLR